MPAQAGIRTDSLFKQPIKQPSVITRILCGAGYAVVPCGPLWSLALPLKNMRGWRAKWRNHCSFVPRSLSRTRSASRRATRTSLRKSGVICGRLPYCAGPRFAGAVQSGLPSSPPGLPSFPTASPAEPRAGLNGRRQPSSWQAALQWPPGGAPAPPGCGRSVRLPPAGAASDPTPMTPHESAFWRIERIGL